MTWPHHPTSRPEPIDLTAWLDFMTWNNAGPCGLTSWPEPMTWPYDLLLLLYPYWSHYLTPWSSRMTWPHDLPFLTASLVAPNTSSCSVSSLLSSFSASSLDVLACGSSSTSSGSGFLLRPRLFASYFIKSKKTTLKKNAIPYFFLQKFILLLSGLLSSYCIPCTHYSLNVEWDDFNIQKP